MTTVKVNKISSVPAKVGSVKQTSTVCEPSLCSVTGTQLFFTGNWFASKSANNGTSWTYMSPYDFLPAPAGFDFCCDQTVIYDPTRKATFWILQYSANATGDNVLRVAVNTTATLEDSKWFWWDFKPGVVNAAWAGHWFDYNHAALSDNFLYVGTNMFKGNTWKAGVVFRFSLDQLSKRQALTYNYYSTTKNGSLRCSLGAKKTMYFTAINSDRQIKVFEWPESKTSVTEYTVSVTRFTTGAYTAICPDGSNWLARCDDRITACWISGNALGCMWTAGSQSGRPFPFARAVRINVTTKKLINEPDIWNPGYAYAYPDVCPNDGGRLGITIFRGGGTIFPGHIVGIYDDPTNTWSLAVTKNGTNGPSDNKWGDYITCRKDGGNGLAWVASGFVLNGGNTRDKIDPIFVKFSL